MSRLIRIYHPYWKWEERDSNMWGRVDNRELHLQRIIKFTGNHVEYGKSMMMVVKRWRYSCEHNLTDISQNRRAWLGHAACALKFNCPEDIVREAWHWLSNEQRSMANAEADKAISFWEENYYMVGINGQKEFGF